MSGGPDLNRRPLRPERVCDPPTRYVAVYGAPGGVPQYPSRAAYAGKVAESAGWGANFGRLTTVDQGDTDTHCAPTPGTAGSDRRGRHAARRCGGEDFQGLRNVGQTAIGNELTPGLTGEALMKVCEGGGRRARRRTRVQAACIGR
jgi:hypothetical protein